MRPDGKLVLQSRLNNAINPEFDLWIQAKDTVSGLSAYRNLAITVRDENDHAPVFEQALYTATVQEQESIFGSKPLVRVKANDADSGVFGQVTYRLVSGNIDNPFILSDDGTLSLTKQLDRETIPRYHVVIEAKDGGDLTSTTIVIIDVTDINDNFPRFTSSYRWQAAEDLPVGSLLSSVHASDADVGINARIVYALETPSDQFDITDTGNITIKSKLDRETQPSYSLIVSARNQGESNLLSGTTSVLITVSN